MRGGNGDAIVNVEMLLERARVVVDVRLSVTLPR